MLPWVRHLARTRNTLQYVVHQLGVVVSNGRHPSQDDPDAFVKKALVIIVLGAVFVLAFTYFAAK